MHIVLVLPLMEPYLKKIFRSLSYVLVFIFTAVLTVTYLGGTRGGVTLLHEAHADIPYTTPSSGDGGGGDGGSSGGGGCDGGGSGGDCGP